jgi:hypothetical protein
MRCSSLREHTAFGRNYHLPTALILWSAASLALTSCSGLRPLRGGTAVTTQTKTGALQQTLVQGENAAQQSRQHQELVKVRNYTVPAGARLEEAKVQALSSGRLGTNVQTLFVTAPMPVTEREETRSEAELGSAQKDTARELSAKLASLRGITWVGVALFVFGLVSLVWPPLKVVIGSVTTSAAIMAGGLTLLVLPTLVAGNELLILGAVALTAGAWFLAHRHGQLRGLLDRASDKPVLKSAPPATRVSVDSVSEEIPTTL